jgi:hypothetical protein
MTKIFTILVLLCLAATGISTIITPSGEPHADPVIPPVEVDRSYLEPAPPADTDPIICEELPILSESDVPEYEVSRARKVQEVVSLWELFFEDEGASRHDPRRNNFHEYAEYLVEAVEMYTENPTDIDGQLPKHRNVHVLLAYMVTRESSVTADAEGPLGEVGLLQIHGLALAGYSKEKVKNNPKLGLLLGVRWLASRLPKCPKSKDLFGVGWDDWDWVRPLSLYAGGFRARNKRTGQCKEFDVAKQRVEGALFYRTRVDHMLRFYDE